MPDSAGMSRKQKVDSPETQGKIKHNRHEKIKSEIIPDNIVLYS